MPRTQHTPEVDQQIHPELARALERIWSRGTHTCFLCAALALRPLIARMRAALTAAAAPVSPLTPPSTLSAALVSDDPAAIRTLEAAGYIVLLCDDDPYGGLAVLQCRHCWQQSKKYRSHA